MTSGNPYYTEALDKVGFFPFYCVLMFTVTFNGRNRWAESHRPNENPNWAHCIRKGTGTWNHRQPSLEQKYINKSIFFIAINGSISCHPWDNNPFSPSYLSNHGNCLWCNDITQFPGQQFPAQWHHAVTMAMLHEARQKVFKVGREVREDTRTQEIEGG